jgi:hypothetical protein
MPRTVLTRDDDHPAISVHMPRYAVLLGEHSIKLAPCVDLKINMLDCGCWEVASMHSAKTDNQVLVLRKCKREMLRCPCPSFIEAKLFAPLGFSHLHPN